MAQRPHALVGETVVVALLFFGRHPDAAQPVVVVTRRHAHPVAGVDHLAVGVATAVRHPGAGTGAHHRLDRRHQAAGRPLDDHAVGGALVDVGLAVRHHDHLIADQLRAQQRAQPVGRPFGVGPLRSPVLVFEVAQAGPQVGGEGRQFGCRQQRAQQAFAAHDRPRTVDPPAPAELRHDDRDQRDHETQPGDQADQVAARFLAAPLDEAHVVQQHEMADQFVHRRQLQRRCGVRFGQQQRLRCALLACRRRRAVTHHAMDAHVHRTAGQRQARVDLLGQPQRLGTTQAVGKPAGALQQAAVGVAQSEGEETFVLRGAIENRHQPVLAIAEHRIGDRIGQRVGDQNPAAVEIPTEPSQRHLIQQGNRHIGRRDQRDHQGQQETQLQARGLQSRPGPALPGQPPALDECRWIRHCLCANVYSIRRLTG